MGWGVAFTGFAVTATTGAAEGFALGAVVGGAWVGCGVETGFSAISGGAVGALTGTAGTSAGAGVTIATCVCAGFGESGAIGAGVGFGGALGLFFASSRCVGTARCPATTGCAWGLAMRGACARGGWMTGGALFTRCVTRTCEVTSSGAPSVDSGEDCSDDDVMMLMKKNARST